MRALILMLFLAGCAGNGMHPGAAGSGDEGDLIQVRQAAQDSYAARNYAESEKHYMLLAQKVPVEAENWFHLGNIYARTNRPDAAIAAYRETLVRDPENRKAWFNMGILQLKSAASSLAELQKLTDPNDPVGKRSREVLEQLQALIRGGAAQDSTDAGTPGE